jgi:hypothetical protein
MRVATNGPKASDAPLAVHVPNQRFTPAKPLALPSAPSMNVGMQSAGSVTAPRRVHRHSPPMIVGAGEAVCVLPGATACSWVVGAQAGSSSASAMQQGREGRNARLIRSKVPITAAICDRLEIP